MAAAKQAHGVIFSSTTKDPGPIESISKIAAKLYRGQKIPVTMGLSCTFCGDARIRRLNREYRKIDCATDVLSFPFNDPEFLGEIYISLPRCKVQARQYGLTFEQEVKRMFIHGFFHLLGFDHKNRMQRDAMESHERPYWDF